MPPFPIFQTTTATTAQNAFSLKLLQTLTETDKRSNVLVSPLGVLAALALAMVGTGGATKAAFEQALFGNNTNPERAAGTFADWLQQLLQTNNPPSEEQADTLLNLATSLWVDHHFELASAFVQQARARYNAEAASLDFNSTAAAPTINSWVRQHTQGRIDSIVSASDLATTPPPELILLNAVYFRGAWAHEFDPDNTRPGHFRRADGTVQEAPFMHQVSGYIGYMAGDGWQAVSLPYCCSGRSFSMLIFLPADPTGLPELLGSLDPTKWASLHKAISSQGVEVELALPRFRVEWRADLAPTLRRLGLASAFTPGADFSALGFQAEKGGGFIDGVMHKTFLEVDEQGTEAAAVTAMMFVGGSAHEPTTPRRVAVKVDAPFLYAIVDDQDSTLLFVGTLNEILE
jgi:serpin B